jgi:hypothetical protein
MGPYVCFALAKPNSWRLEAELDFEYQASVFRSEFETWKQHLDELILNLAEGPNECRVKRER